MVTDTISDILTRIRNASRVQHNTVNLPNQRISKQIAEILVKEGFIDSISISASDQLILYLKYQTSPQRLNNEKNTKKISVIRGLKRISRPGIRVYVSSKKIPPMLEGMGIHILSTSHGIMTDKEAKFRSLGGELLCSVW